MNLPVPNILVVEDHADTRAGFAMVLDGLGYRYELACGAEEALVMAARTPFDALLTDVYMPQVGGWELVRRLRAHGYLPAKVVSMSAGSATVESAQSDAAGCHTHLHKPFSIEKLTLALRRSGSSKEKGSSDLPDDEGQRCGLGRSNS